jgi:K+-transporting ATPase ATPase C chain
MDNAIEKVGLLRQAETAVRTVVVTMAICCLLYPLFILGVAQTWRPYSANGSLARNNRGEIVGSALLAQGFSRPEYFWPRPSEVEYNAAAAGGSNLSPTNPELRVRAKAQAARFGATAGDILPADLATASASGLDPHITLAAANYQTVRVASARGLSVETVKELLARHAQRPGGALTPEPLVNVLLVNLELDRLDKGNEQ